MSEVNDLTENENYFPPPRFMKFVFAATAALLFCVPARAELVEYWAPGVSRESGWTNTFQFRNGCWAAVASNMVDWWQQRIEAKYGAGEKHINPETLNTRYDTNPYFKSGGDYIWKAIDWYLKETYPAIVNTRPDLWNYYLPEGDPNPPMLFTRGWLNSGREAVQNALMTYFTSGNYVAALTSANHTWTLYGMQVDTDTGKITKVWATDSVPNDRTNQKKQLHEFDAVYSNTARWGDLLIFSRGIYDPENNSWGQQNIEATEITFLSCEDKFLVDANGRSVFQQGVPEPSVFGLLAGTLALALAGTRRRKRTENG